MTRKAILTLCGCVILGFAFGMLLNSYRGQASAEKAMVMLEGLDGQDRDVAASWMVAYLAAQHPTSPTGGYALSRLVDEQLSGLSMDRAPINFSLRNAPPFLGILGIGMLSGLSLILVLPLLSRSGAWVCLLGGLLQCGVSIWVAAVLGPKLPDWVGSAGSLSGVLQHWWLVCISILILLGIWLIAKHGRAPARHQKENQSATNRRASGRMIAVWRGGQVLLIAAIVVGLSWTTSKPVLPASDSSFFEIEASAANLRGGPSTRFNVVGSAKAGSRFQVLGTYQGWHKVLLPAGTIAWVSDSVGKVEPQ